VRQRLAITLPAVLLAAGCAGPAVEPTGLGATEARALVVRLLPARVPDRAGWAADVHGALTALELTSTPQSICAVLAVAEQESGFQADPPVAGLAKIARTEIERRAADAGVPAFALSAALALSSPDGRSYAERLDAVKTERELSAIYEDFIGMVPFGKTLFASRNPVRTGGPMQVSIAFAETQVQQRPYPYALRDGSVRHEVFTRRGGLYFGTAHLLDYAAPYEQPLYRFADFNAGRWASRNAAFQQALALASGLPVTPDGDLLPPAGGAPGETERAASSLARRLDLSESSIRHDLALGEGPGFERSALWERVFAWAEKLERRALPRAALPRIDLKSPKITRKLTTEWFARRVDERYQRCVARAVPPG
jgi:hypothetical protein